MQSETWHHANGCRMWIIVERDTMTPRKLPRYAPRMTAGQRPSTEVSHDRKTPAKWRSASTANTVLNFTWDDKAPQRLPG
eukprot:UN12297